MFCRLTDDVVVQGSLFCKIFSANTYYVLYAVVSGFLRADFQHFRKLRKTKFTDGDFSVSQVQDQCGVFRKRSFFQTRKV